MAQFEYLSTLIHKRIEEIVSLIYVHYHTIWLGNKCDFQFCCWLKEWMVWIWEILPIVR